jgi:ATP-dependent RNA helicase RhlE
VPVLVATDIAARGIDVPGVSAVFNFEIPNVAEQYVHRIGRTARAGRSGLAISYIAPDERPYIRDIERLTGVKLSQAPLPEDFIAQAKSLPAPARKGSGAERSDQDQNARFRKGGGGGRNGGGRGGNSRGNPQNNSNKKAPQPRDRNWRDAEGRSPDQGNYRSREDRDQRSGGREGRDEPVYGRAKNVSHKKGPVTKPVVAAKRRDDRSGQGSGNSGGNSGGHGGNTQSSHRKGGRPGGNSGGGNGGGRPQRRRQS